VRLLLDTHVLIWWARDQRLAAEVASAIGDGANDVAISVASLWEAEIKAASGKLELDLDLAADAKSGGLITLPIEASHAVAAARLPQHHRDPFDRMLIAQARLEGFAIVTRDPAFQAYGVPLMAA